MTYRAGLVALAGLVASLATEVPAAEPFFVLASTTSTEQSGLFGFILPRFTAQTGIAVRVVAVGTGQALAIGARGDADVLLVHDRPGEDKFVADGFGVDRRDVMFNDYVVLGPKSDPAGVSGRADAVYGLRRVQAAAAAFVSRGDDSGTHRLERRLWQLAGLEPRAPWYRETGSGMGATLNMASALNAYTVSDRGTWASFKNRGELAILVAGDARLFNPYGVILVNPARHLHVKCELALAFSDWLTGPDGQRAIGAYEMGDEPLFKPNAGPGPAEIGFACPKGAGSSSAPR